MKNLLKILSFVTTVAASLLTAGCGNELDERNLGESPSSFSFTATIEQEGATKTLMGVKYTSGSTTYRPVEWVTGDQIAISGASASYTAGTPTNNNRTATFTGSGAQMEDGLYKAYYPATIYNNKKTSFPATQTYGGLSGSKTIIGDLPMYAASSTTSLTFRNLCAVLNFRLKGESTQKVTAIEVSSSNQNLWGEFTIGGTPESPTVTMNPATGGRAVTLNCGAGVALSPTTEKEFFIAIPAQTYEPGTLTIQIKDGTTTLATLTNSSATAAQTTFSRNQIYEIGKDTGPTIPPIVPGTGRFSVSDTRKVNFTTSNLMYAGASGDTGKKWRLMDRPWSVIEQGTGTTFTPSADTDFGLMAFGTAGSSKSPWATDTDPTSYGYPTSISTDSNYFGFENSNYASSSGRMYDWGRNTVYSGSGSVINNQNKLRVLTSAEWCHLLSDEPYTGFGANWTVRSMTNPDTPKYVLATVASTPGVIIFPDDYNTSTYPHPPGVAMPVKKKPQKELFSDNVYSEADFLKMTDAGAVFLPASGVRHSGFNGGYSDSQPLDKIIAFGEQVAYWTASVDGSEAAFYLSIYEENNNRPRLFPTASLAWRSWGLAVRLVWDPDM